MKLSVYNYRNTLWDTKEKEFRQNNQRMMLFILIGHRRRRKMTEKEVEGHNQVLQYKEL